MTTIRHQDHEGGVRVLTLDRPPANAIDETLLGDLAAAVRAAADDEAVRAVVLTGAGTFFSGGFDFRAARRDDAASRHVHTLYRDAHRALLALPKPTLAMMRGHAVAGGLVLVLACDSRTRGRVSSSSAPRSTPPARPSGSASWTSSCPQSASRRRCSDGPLV